MPKSKIILAIVNNDISIDKSLMQLQVLAHDVHNDELQEWAEHELTGYPTEDVPEYRKARSLLFNYTGINGTFNVKDAPLPLGFLSSETLDEVSKVIVKEDILSVQQMSESDSGAYRDLSILAGEVYKQSGGVQCVSIRQKIPNTLYKKIVAEVKNRIVKALMILEERYGHLDNLGINIREPKSFVGNLMINEALGLPQPSAPEPIRSKIAWKIIVPIIIAVSGGVLMAIINKIFSL